MRTALAALLVLFALVTPDDLSKLTFGSVVRIPLEALGCAALILAVPVRARRATAIGIGVLLGLLTVLRLLDTGFFAVLDRPFRPLLDWPLLGSALDFLTASVGRAGAVVAVVAAITVAVALFVLLSRSTVRLTGVLVRHRTRARGTVAVLAVAWVAAAAFAVPVVSDGAAVRLGSAIGQGYTDLHDPQRFAALAADDPFRDVPADRLLAGLRGKDVVLAFVESYGRDAVENPRYAEQLREVLDDGGRRLAAAGYGARSGYLTSPTVGGGSWLAHATLLSGLWIDHQQRYRDLGATGRLPLTGAFRRAGWRTVAVLPATNDAWPEGEYFVHHRVYAGADLDYRGPRFTFSSIPDQYTLSAFQRLERSAPGRAPVMAEIALISSHGPWTPVPRLVDWDSVDDGSVFHTMARTDEPQEVVLRDVARVRTEYPRAIEYSLRSVISYVERYGDDDLVLIFLGDHQPARIITGDDASRDVPITIVARDPAVLERISGWGWHDGLRPGVRAPVWPMDTFRDRFLTAFGPAK